MSVDLGFAKDDLWFRYRTGALILHEDKVLFCKNKIGGYYYFLGGAVQHGETSEDCIVREIQEETSLTAYVDMLSVVLENMFHDRDKDGNELNCHTIEFYYRAHFDHLEGMNKVTDINEELAWIPIADIPSMDIRPKAVADRLQEILQSNNIFHIVNTERL